ncbi:hypothetical protein BSKO_03716 [Bryopsis sp. KO-2023]|nr:hypothetical protein BSKO_03716 [Bryopsis sp. KO-2023]
MTNPTVVLRASGRPVTQTTQQLAPKARTPPLAKNSPRSNSEPSLLMDRRSLLGISLGLIAPVLVDVPATKANLLQDFTKVIARPDVDDATALVMLLDARGVLLEVNALALTPRDSDLRKEYNSFLPGMARRLRDVGRAAPALAASLTGVTKDGTLSDAYGGDAGAEEGSGLVDPIFIAVGKVLTSSGRGIERAALVLPELSENAVSAINTFLDKVPKEQIDKAQEFRQSRSL